MTDAMFSFLGSLSNDKAVGFKKGDAGIHFAAEAWQRGWVRVSGNGPVYGNDGTVYAISVLGLSKDGWRTLDAERAARVARRPMARLRRVFLASGRWALSSIDRILLSALCGETVLRWIYRLFFAD